MKRLDRYIRNNVLLAIALVLLVLGGLDLIFTVLEEVGDTDELYTTSEAISYVLLTFPRHLYELLPMSSLIGALVGLGILASSNELVVMQAAGIRVSRIVWAVMKPTGIIMILSLVLGEFIAPPMDLKAEVDKAVTRGGEKIVTREGYWLKEGRTFLHTNAIEPGGVLHQVTIYEYDEDRQPTLHIYANRADFISESENQGHWRLSNVSLSRFSKRQEGLESLHSTQDYFDFDFDLSPELLQVLVLDADKMAISDLYQYARYFESQGQDSSQYFLSFWKKVLQPLTTAALVLVAISFIFGPLRSATMGSRLFVAIFFGLFFFIMQRLINTVSLVYQFEPIAAVLLPILLSIVAGLYLLRRAA